MEQLDMWLDCKPEPDCDGLFDASGVAWLAGRHRCAVTAQSDLVLTVTAKSSIQLIAMAPGRWDPVSILAACTKARGQVAYDVDIETASITNPGGLDELKIAHIVGADGLRPYLSRSGQYRRSANRVQRPLRQAIKRKIADEGWCLIDDDQFPIVDRGMPTWAFLQVLQLQALSSNQSYEFRRAMRTLADVGLLRIDPARAVD